MSEETFGILCPECGVPIGPDPDKRSVERRLENHRVAAHNGRRGSWSDEAYYREAAEKLAAARVRYAQEFARFRMRMQSDGAAHQAAIEATKDEITVLQAELKIAERRLP